MKIETLKRSHIKRNIIIGVVVVAIISAIILNFTRAKYRSVATTPLIHSTINYSAADLNIVAITVDGEEVDTISTGNYELSEESYCEVNGTRDDSVELSYDIESQMLTVTPMTTKGTKCYLDFKTATTKNVETVLGTIKVNLDTPNFSKTSCSSGCGEATVGIYETTDNDGTSYYWRGDVDNNWVQFGGYYWRIVRVNGDGSVRLIYNGTSTTTTGSGILINNGESYAFNGNYDQYEYYEKSEYVGLKYTLGQQHGQSTDSPILDVLQSWYISSGLSGYSQYIDSSVGFCSDRNVASGYDWSSTGNEFYYAAYERLVSAKNPSLACDSSDIIQEPAGFITADEASYAGAVYKVNNTSYYLYTDQYYWTMTPFEFSIGRYSYNFIMNSTYFSEWAIFIETPCGIRPVINLSSDVQITGNGTVDSPYQVVGA